MFPLKQKFNSFSRSYLKLLTILFFKIYTSFSLNYLKLKLTSMTGLTEGPRVVGSMTGGMESEVSNQHLKTTLYNVIFIL